MVLEVLMVFCDLMGFGALAKQTADRNWSFLLLLHDPCHRAPLFVECLLESDFRSSPVLLGSAKLLHILL